MMSTTVKKRRIEKRPQAETNRVLLAVRIDPALLQKLRKKAPTNISALVEKILEQGIDQVAA